MMITEDEDQRTGAWDEIEKRLIRLEVRLGETRGVMSSFNSSICNLIERVGEFSQGCIKDLSLCLPAVLSLRKTTSSRNGS